MKQRLVGALILVALGVVFWPIIFVEPGTPAGSEAVQVPPRPQIDTAPLPAPDEALLREVPPPAEPAPLTDAELAGLRDTPPPDSNAPATAQAKEEAPAEPNGAAPEAAAPPEPGETRSEAPLKPELDADGIPIAWALQVASVSDSERADKLRADLLALGYKAYIKRVRSGGKTLYRVSVGPKGEKARLEAIRGEIDTEFGVTSLVVRYYP